ncbi:embryo defective [Forsythia ovata]|uniref:Embryo defective n=1 Tax=Forsythia ovata TaxID=205694 RepID=A0ABD1WFA1_9LAMI
MSCKLQNSFLWVPLQCNVIQRKNKGNYVHQNGVKVKPSKKGSKFHTVKCAKKHDWMSQGIKFTHFHGKNVELLWKKLGLQSSWMINSVKEPLVRSKTLVRSMAPLWEEGLFLIRCSIFCAVMSGVCLLVWYGQLKAKSYVEARLLPRVCALLSDHFQRELDFGKVRRISPLSITLESCSIGPHNEEFSCGEHKRRTTLGWGYPIMKALHIGTCQPKKELIFVQGLGGLQERKLCFAGRGEEMTQLGNAAENGYVISEASCILSEGDLSKESASLPTRFTVPQESFFYMDEKIHQRDHHCMDAGVEYDLKHADLEKAFGARIAQSRNIWTKIIPGPMRHQFKRRANGRDLSMAGIAAKRRILERSASEARAYFWGQSRGESGNYARASGAYDVLNLESSLKQTEGDTASSISAVTSSERDARADNQNATYKNC